MGEWNCLPDASAAATLFLPRPLSTLPPVPGAKTQQQQQANKGEVGGWSSVANPFVEKIGAFHLNKMKGNIKLK